MPTLEQKRSQRDVLQNLLSGLSDFSSEELARLELGQDVNFANGVIFFDRILRLFRGLKGSDLEDVPYSKLNALSQSAKGAFDLLQEVRDFSMKNFQNNPLAQRDSIINRARDQYDQMFEVVAPIIAFTVRKGTDFQRLEHDGREALKRIELVGADCDTKLKGALGEAEEALAQVRNIAQEAGVSQHAIHFKNEADQSELSAKPWLRTAGWLAGGTILVGVILILDNIIQAPTLTSAQSIQFAIPKLFVFSILLSATVWCGRTYRACRHNAVVNRHRQNALATFQAFAKATSDQAIKDAVLLQATQCIFSQQPTGYIHAEPEPTALPISEMMKAINR